MIPAVVRLVRHHFTLLRALAHGVSTLDYSGKPGFEHALAELEAARAVELFPRPSITSRGRELLGRWKDAHVRMEVPLV